MENSSSQDYVAVNPVEFWQFYRGREAKIKKKNKRHYHGRKVLRGLNIPLQGFNRLCNSVKLSSILLTQMVMYHSIIVMRRQKLEFITF